MDAVETGRLQRAIRESLRLQVHGQYLLERAERLLITQRNRHNEADRVFGSLRRDYEETMRQQARSAEPLHRDATED